MFTGKGLEMPATGKRALNGNMSRDIVARLVAEFLALKEKITGLHYILNIRHLAVLF